MGFLKQKKGDIVSDPIVVFIVILFMGITAFVGLKMLNGYSNTIISSEPANSTFTNVTSTVQSGAGSGINDGILLAIGLLFVVGLVLASQISVDPRWIWLGIVFGLVVMWGLWQARDTFSNSVSSTSFAQERAQAPQAYNALSGIGYLVILFFILLFAVVYSRISGSSGGVG